MELSQVEHNHGRRLLYGFPDPEKTDLENKHQFAFSPEQLAKLVNYGKSMQEFHTIGGIAGLERGLRTDRCCGLRLEETILDKSVLIQGSNHGFLSGVASGGVHCDAFADRKRMFQGNTMPTTKPPNTLRFLQLMWMAYNDPILIALTAAAAVSLIIGFYQTFGNIHTLDEPRKGWAEGVEGVAILTAIIIIVLVASVNDWQKERQFAKLNKKKLDRTVKVIRSAKSQEIPISDLLVGDVVCIETGDVIPADGIFIDGYNVKCDESSTTGESGMMRKHSAEEVFRVITIKAQEKQLAHQEAHTYNRKLDPFIFSGPKVVEGLGTFLVTATGANSCYGRILLSLEEESSFPSLQVKLREIAKAVVLVCHAADLLFFVMLFIESLVQSPA